MFRQFSNQTAQPVRCFNAETEARFAGAALCCAAQVSLSDPGISPALAHLILDTLAELGAAERMQRSAPDAAEQQQAQQASRQSRDGGPPAAVAATQSQLHAARVLLACCASQPRLAPKVAAAFRLDARHLSTAQQVQLLDAVSMLLDANATSASGVSLLLHPGFAPLRRHFHLEAVLEDLVLSAQDPVAVRLAQELGSREMQARGRGFKRAGPAAAGAALSWLLRWPAVAPPPSTHPPTRRLLGACVGGRVPGRRWACSVATSAGGATSALWPSRLTMWDDASGTAHIASRAPAAVAAAGVRLVVPPLCTVTLRAVLHPRASPPPPPPPPHQPTADVPAAPVCAVLPAVRPAAVGQQCGQTFRPAGGGPGQAWSLPLGMLCCWLCGDGHSMHAVQGAPCRWVVW